jgi:hypothetical protein
MGRSRALRRIRAGIAVLAAVVALLTARRDVRAETAAFDGSAVVQRDGNPTLLVDGKPFFFYGAAFFYERIPAERWRASMLALRTLGFNTLDLYVPWNWHEIADGDFDFNGRTNAGRNLRALLVLARDLDFKLIVRPGPVIRNEWRNGGYPAWLLSRPEYGMPQHDVLEGRYPATATLQNANSDDAAAQWLTNPTHLSYAGRWLSTVLREFAPFRDRVIAVQLDDDQGAYIDNQTWPAPHLQTYLHRLESIVRSVVGPQLPVFINTYEMKVTASAPVWAMGNWYQSDAYSIGEHDRTALEFSTGLLQTQTRYPVAMSEFQAGWLAPPEDPAPRPADPTNTTLALHTLLGFGARGVIDFPAQDTIDPAGWEAPFANEDYAWDAALTVDLGHSARYAPTALFGGLVRAHGAELAAARRLADGAIAYLTSAYDERQQTNADVFAIVARTQAAQHDCRARNLACDVVDLRFISDAALRRYPFVIVPVAGASKAFIDTVKARLARYRTSGGRVVAAVPAGVVPHAGGIANATVLAAPDGTAFLDIVNYADRAQAVPATRIHLGNGHDEHVGPLEVAARDALLVPLGSRAEPLPAPPASAAEIDDAPVACRAPAGAERAGSGAAVPQAIADDSAADGFARIHLRNGLVNVTLTPDAGARAFSFVGNLDPCPGKQLFTPVGALRDDVAVQPPLSTTDRIGKYTRSFPAGTFNRSYNVHLEQGTRSVAATFSYDAHFERTVTLVGGDPGFTVKERVTFAAGPGAGAQRSVRYDSFASRGATIIDDRTAGALGFFFAAESCVAIVAWPPGDVEDARLLPEPTSTVLRLQFAPGRETSTRYAIVRAADIDAARAAIVKERAAAAAKR